MKKYKKATLTQRQHMRYMKKLSNIGLTPKKIKKAAKILGEIKKYTQRRKKYTKGRR